MNWKFYLLLLLCATKGFSQSWLYEEQIHLDSVQGSLGASELEPIAPDWMVLGVPVQNDQQLKNASVEVPVEKPQETKVASTDSLVKKDSTADEMAEESQSDESGVSTLQLVILSADDGKPLDKAVVLVKVNESLMKAESDANGMVLLRGVPAGERDVSVTRKGYTAKNLVKVRFLSGKKWSEEVTLDRRIAVGKTMTVQKPRATTSENMMAQRQNSALVMEGVSAEQIAKSTDADAGAIAKRVTGTSVVGGKYVFVRGLGERYTNMTMNGLPVPSPEKDKRVVPQDLFPASILESFAIYKTFSPQLPADFAGGSVSLETKGFPDKDFWKVGVGLGATEYIGDGAWLDLGAKRLDARVGNTLGQWLGFPGSSMNRPSGMPSIINKITVPNDSDRAELARKWNRKWSIDTLGMKPDQSYSLATGKTWKSRYDGQAGFIANLAFKNDYKQSERKRIKVAQNGVKDSVTIIRNGVERRVLQTIRDTVDGVPRMLEYLVPGIEQTVDYGAYATSLSALLNWGYRNRDHSLWAKSFYANLSEEIAMYNKSVADVDISAGQENPIEERFYSEFNRRSVGVLQAGGSHYIGRSVLDSMAWAVGIAQSTGETPDSRKYYFSRYDSTEMRYDVKPPFGTRQYQDFSEFGLSGRADFFLIMPPEWSAQDLFHEEPGLFSRIQLPTMASGFLWSNKHREFDVTTYSWAGLDRMSTTEEDYSIVDLVHNPDSVAQFVAENGIGFSTNPTDYDNYESDEASFSLYSNVQENLQIQGFPSSFQAGLRMEFYSLDFLAPYTSERSYIDESLRMDSARIIDQFDINIYPSVSAHFEFFPRTKMRFLLSQTLVRPEIRERAPTFFYDPVDEIEVIGNPDLKDTRITHWDFRFEWFLPWQQMMSASIFYKDFKDPIEMYINGNLSPNRKMFQNAKGAFVQGVEVEADLSPQRLLKKEWAEYLDGLSFYVNAAWIYSRVRLDTSTSGADLLTSSNRPMIGQSPYLYNFKLAHERKWGSYSIMNALLYNISGRRISALGVDGIPDTYEEPFASLEYMLKAEKGQHTVSLKLKNLLNSAQVYTVSEFNHKIDYEVISDEYRDELYSKVDWKEKIEVSKVKPGIGISLSWDYKF